VVGTLIAIRMTMTVKKLASFCMFSERKVWLFSKQSIDFFCSSSSLFRSTTWLSTHPRLFFFAFLFLSFFSSDTQAHPQPPGTTFFVLFCFVLFCLVLCALLFTCKKKKKPDILGCESAGEVKGRRERGVKWGRKKGRGKSGGLRILIPFFPHKIWFMSPHDLISHYESTKPIFDSQHCWLDICIFVTFRASFSHRFLLLFVSRRINVATHLPCLFPLYPPTHERVRIHRERHNRWQQLQNRILGANQQIRNENHQRKSTEKIDGKKIK